MSTAVSSVILALSEYLASVSAFARISVTRRILCPSASEAVCLMRLKVSAGKFIISCAFAHILTIAQLFKNTSKSFIRTPTLLPEDSMLSVSVSAEEASSSIMLCTMPATASKSALPSTVLTSS